MRLGSMNDANAAKYLVDHFDQLAAGFEADGDQRDGAVASVGGGTARRDFAEADRPQKTFNENHARSING